MTKDAQLKKIAWGLFLALVILGQVLAYIRYGNLGSEAIGYGFGLVVLGLIVHGLMIRKTSVDSPENKARLRNTIIFDVLYMALVYSSEMIVN